MLVQQWLLYVQIMVNVLGVIIVNTLLYYMYLTTVISGCTSELHKINIEILLKIRGTCYKLSINKFNAWLYVIVYTRLCIYSGKFFKVNIFYGWLLNNFRSNNCGGSRLIHKNNKNIIPLKLRTILWYKQCTCTCMHMITYYYGLKQVNTYLYVHVHVLKCTIMYIFVQSWTSEVLHYMYSIPCSNVVILN